MKKIVATWLCWVALFAALFAAGPLRRAPGFCLSDTTGEWRDLADYRGKIVLVEFMKTDCQHCASFSTVLNGLKLKYADKLAILAIANPPDNPQTMAQFVNGHKLAYPLLFDRGQVAASYVPSSSIDLVEFMKTDCQHCASFSTVLNGLKLKYADKLAILAIANPPDNPQTMAQ